MSCLLPSYLIHAAFPYLSGIVADNPDIVVVVGANGHGGIVPVKPAGLDYCIVVVPCESVVKAEVNGGMSCFLACSQSFTS